MVMPMTTTTVTTAAILMSTTASSSTQVSFTPPPITSSQQTKLHLPSILPTVSGTTTTGMESISFSQTVFRFLQPQENPYMLHVSPNQQSITLNCTAFYNGSNNNITIQWTRNDRVIFIDTEQYTEMNIVSTVLVINGQSFGSYTCTFHHSLGQSARELQIISSGKMQYCLNAC